MSSNSSFKTVYFMQHGLALSKDQNPERPLSYDGIQQTTTIARHLAGLSFSTAHIYHSGKPRALQTAEILATATAIGPNKLTQHVHLSPNDDIQLLITQLQDQSLYVGHLPHLDKLCSFLLAGDASANIIRFENSGIVCLQLNQQNPDQQQWQLGWYLTPASIKKR